MQVSIGTGQRNRIRDILIVSITLVAFGIILILISYFQLNKGANWVPLKAEIVDMVSRYSGRSTTYDVFVKYKYNDDVYPRQLLDTYVAGMQIKQMIDIKVNPNSPTEFMYAAVELFNALYIAGGCLIGIGILMPSIWIPIKIHKKKAQILEVENETKNKFLKKMK